MKKLLRERIKLLRLVRKGISTTTNNKWRIVEIEDTIKNQPSKQMTNLLDEAANEARNSYLGIIRVRKPRTIRALIQMIISHFLDILFLCETKKYICNKIFNIFLNVDTLTNFHYVDCNIIKGGKARGFPLLWGKNCKP